MTTPRSYRQRVEPLARDAARLEATRRQFESFIARLGDALRAAMPQAEVKVLEARALVEKPSRRPAQPAPPTSRRYDPYAYHYGSPLDSIVSMVMWSSLLSMGTITPTVISGAATSAAISRSTSRSSQMRSLVNL